MKLKLILNMEKLKIIQMYLINKSQKMVISNMILLYYQKLEKLLILESQKDGLKEDRNSVKN